MNLRAALTRGALGGCLAIAVALAMANRDAVQLAAPQEMLRPMGMWAPALFIGLYAIGTVLFLPGSVFGLAGGALFGPLWGSVWNLAGATLGATLAFLTARYVTGGWVARQARGRLARIVAGVEADGWRFVALTRLIPLIPFNLLNYTLGLTRIRATDYVLATVIGMMPGTIAYTWIGHAGMDLAAGGESVIRNALLAVGGLAVLLLAPSMVRRLRRATSRPFDLEKSP